MDLTVQHIHDIYYLYLQWGIQLPTILFNDDNQGLINVGQYTGLASKPMSYSQMWHLKEYKTQLTFFHIILFTALVCTIRIILIQANISEMIIFWQILRFLRYYLAICWDRPNDRLRLFYFLTESYTPLLLRTFILYIQLLLHRIFFIVSTVVFITVGLKWLF